MKEPLLRSPSFETTRRAVPFDGSRVAGLQAKSQFPFPDKGFPPVKKIFLAATTVALLALGTMRGEAAAPCCGPRCLKVPPPTNAYQLRCVRQSTFIETACCPMCLNKYVHCPDTCCDCPTTRSHTAPVQIQREDRAAIPVRLW